MRTSAFTVPRFEPMQPWANRILWIDLSDMTVRAEPSSSYMPDYLGSRGLAARLCWHDYPEPVPAFAPENPLMVVPGALTGSRAPYAGRTTIHAFSPQAWPHEWFTRSSIGGHFGGELKRAGYDALIVTGACDSPVRIQIHDDQVRVLPADDLWGLDMFDALEALDAAEGRGAHHLTIGPAGERLSRIATIQSASSTAAGQGGFGAVMGSKQLKAISVHGTGRVKLADPDRMTALSRAMARDLKRDLMLFGNVDKLNATLKQEGGGRVLAAGCTEGCLSPCSARFEDMPGVVQKGMLSGNWTCSAYVFGPWTRSPVFAPLAGTRFYDSDLSYHAGFEMNVLTNRYGLNQYDLALGMVPWLVASQKEGLVQEMGGMRMDWHDPNWWAHFLRLIAERRDEGDALAEGGLRASRALGFGEHLAAQRYPGWGHASHWDGHMSHLLPFPYWLVAALQWVSDTRDPISTGHAYMYSAGMRWGIFAAQDEAERHTLISRAREIGESLYGTPDAFDPLAGYAGKARVASQAVTYSALLDLVPLGDQPFPLQNTASPDGPYKTLHDVDGLGDVDGSVVEELVFGAGVGRDWGRKELDHAAQRTVALERALQVRHFGRNRALDEMWLPYFEEPEIGMNPLIGEHVGLDRTQFSPVLTEFYSLNGWDANGQPTRPRMSELGMGALYDEMRAGGEEKAAAA